MRAEREPAAHWSILELRINCRRMPQRTHAAYRERFDRRGVFFLASQRLWEGRQWSIFRRSPSSPKGTSVELPDAKRSPTAIRSSKPCMVGGPESAPGILTPEEADAAGKDLYSMDRSGGQSVVPSSDPPNVEPTINVKPAEKTGSDSRMVFRNVGDAPACPAESRAMPRQHAAIWR